jgi:antibiotic biosynthesis monooxygenase (ABM) superfamily enzyme
MNAVAPGLWLVSRVALIVIGTTALMTWLVPPHIARPVEGWLYRTAAERRAVQSIERFSRMRPSGYPDTLRAASG